MGLQWQPKCCPPCRCPNRKSNATHEDIRCQARGCAARAHEGFVAVGRRGVSQCSSGAARPARLERTAPDRRRVLVRRRAPRAARPAALAEPARRMAPGAGQRPARHLARPLDGADRDRWPARADRPGVGPARVAVTPGRAKALSAGADRIARAAADRPRARLARSLRPSRLSDDPRARPPRCALCHLARRRRAPRSLGRGAGAHHRARLVGVAHAARRRAHGDRRAVAAFLRPRPEGPQRHAVVVACDPHAAPRGLLQRRHRPHDRIRDDPRTARPV